MEEGDIIIGKPESDFKYSTTNSHVLMKIQTLVGSEEAYVYLLETDYDREEILASKRTHSVVSMRDFIKLFKVELKYFKKASQSDKSKFLIWKL